VGSKRIEEGRGDGEVIVVKTVSIVHSTSLHNIAVYKIPSIIALKSLHIIVPCVLEGIVVFVIVQIMSFPPLTPKLHVVHPSFALYEPATFIADDAASISICSF